MEDYSKLVYEVPSTTVFEVRQEGVICTSGTRNGYGSANTDIDPGELDGDGIWNWD